MNWAAPQASLLPDGRRLHLHHGPIDLIVEVFGQTREACFARATTRFHTILSELAIELSHLRLPLTEQTTFSDPVARRMQAATVPYVDVFVTAMAAVAGAVADEILAAMIAENPPAKAYVNNGGDIAVHLSAGQSLITQSPAGEMKITANSPTRGIATSGWQGRSHSLGIADAVTVAAPTAAAADVAATLIANAVDLPDHPAVQRTPANQISPDSDLGTRLVTTQVGHLVATDVEVALARGAKYAQTLCDMGLIQQAALTLQGQSKFITAAHSPPLIGDLAHV